MAIIQLARRSNYLRVLGHSENYVIHFFSCLWSLVKPSCRTREWDPSTTNVFRPVSCQCVFISLVLLLQKGNDANKVTVPSLWLGRVDYIPGLTVHRLFQEAGTDPQDLNLGRNFHFSHHL